MRLIFVSLGYYPDLVGGAYRYVTEIAERLAARNHDVHVIYPAAHGQPPQNQVRNAVQLHSFVNADGPFWSNWRQENRSAQRAVDELLVDCADSTAVLLCHAYFGPAIQRINRPFLFLFTGPWAEEFRFSRNIGHRSLGKRLRDTLIGRVMRAVEGRALRQSRQILTISRYYLDMLPVWHKPPLPETLLISGGVDLERFHPSERRTALRRQLGLGDDDFLFPHSDAWTRAWDCFS
jgi:glycosyltransferase involved in cell wall biosynthesis